MPASETQQEGRRGGRLLTVVFWIGVGLAPLAALLLLIGGASGLKVAAVLAILAVVLVGLSVMLRPDAGSLRVELEETMLDEIDMLREDVRQDITTAARATHKSFSEKLQMLHENVEVLRGQVESMRAAGQERAEAKSAPVAARTAPVPPPEPQAASPMVAGGGVVRHTETVRETTRQTIVDQHGDAERGTVYGGGGGGTHGRQAEPATPPPTHRRAGGDRSDREPERGRSDRDGWGPGRDDREESWTEQRLRERLAEGRGAGRAGESRSGPDDYRGGDSRGSDSRGGGHRGGGHYRDSADDYPSGDIRGREEYPSGDVRGSDDSWRPRRHDRDDPADDPRWSEVRAGDRWAAVRSDDRGRELRMGERRAEMHSDESGTEMRIEDRWASVRREESRRDEARRDEGRREEGRRDEGRRDEGRRDEGRRSEGRRSEYSRDAEPVRASRDETRGSRHESRSRDDSPDSYDEPRETRRERREREERWSAEPSGESRPAGRRAHQEEEPPSRSEGSVQRRGSVPALPAAPGHSASTWTQGWREDPAEREREREREPRRRRDEDRDDRWERDDTGSRNSGSRSHRIDFELSDDRWR
ncbi:MAG TPA: hypothetical protein VGJ07_30850 [Rugosimonospora sp.]